MKEESKTITFRCPWCNNTCAFKDVNSGKSARCTGCQNYFIIPQSDNAKVEKIKPGPLESQGDLISGFYPAALKKSWAIIFSKSSAAGLIFVITLMVVKFFAWNFNFKLSFYVQATGKTVTIPLFFGRTIGVCSYALIFWYCMELIYAAAFGDDNFPKIKLGSLVDIVCKIVKSLYFIFVSVAVTQLPTLAAAGIMKMLQVKSALTLIVIGSCCCFALPMLILMAAISQDLVSVLRIDLAVRAIFHVFIKYSLAASITLLVVIAAVFSKNYHRITALESPMLTLVFLAVNVLSAVTATYSARVLGLLYKHHGGQMPW